MRDSSSPGRNTQACISRPRRASPPYPRGGGRRRARGLRLLDRRRLPLRRARWPRGALPRPFVKRHGHRTGSGGEGKCVPSCWAASTDASSSSVESCIQSLPPPTSLADSRAMGRDGPRRSWPRLSRTISPTLHPTFPTVRGRHIPCSLFFSV